MTRLARGFLLVALLAALGGCGERPSSAEIAAWRDEARAADEARKSERRAAEEAGWRLAISGATSGTTSGPGGAFSREGDREGVSSSPGGAFSREGYGEGVSSSPGVVLEWKTLQSLATEVVRTRSPHVPPYPDRPVAFRGVPLGALLERAGADPNAETLTLVCADAYRVEVSAQDARQAPIILAIEADGRPIARNMGGPIYAVFPIEEDARIRAIYTHEKWAFYVSAIVVGTDARRVRVTGKGAGKGIDKGAAEGAGETVLDAEALARLPEVRIEAKVGYRTGWPRDPVTLQGRRLRDVCAAAGRPLTPGDVVIVRGKAPIDRDPRSPHRIAAEDALASDILLVERSGATGTRVPASKGGPLLLGFPAELAGRYAPGEWVTFVEEIEVVRQ